MKFQEKRYKITSKVFDDYSTEINVFDIAFIGEPVDSRGKKSINELSGTLKTVYQLKFDVNKQEMFLNGIPVLRKELAKKIENKKILLDTTTLGVAEILQILKSANIAALKKVHFLYVEPKQYKKSGALTENCQFRGIHGFTHEYSSGQKSSHVFLLGFEAGRMLNAIEQRGGLDPENQRCHLVVGVPAFKFGWELDSIKPHLDLMYQLNISEQSITYCAANSIQETYLTLWDLYKSMGSEQECFFVVPLGTKPHSVGAALFLLETQGANCTTSLYYDHPERVVKRSGDVGKWHFVSVVF